MRKLVRRLLSKLDEVLRSEVGDTFDFLEII
jgi:hypothetical protein